MKQIKPVKTIPTALLTALIFVLLAMTGAARAFSGENDGSIAGIVYDDLNGNGIYEIGEPGLAGVAVDLSGGKIESTVTDENGLYAFIGLLAGDYVVEEIDLSGYVSTSADVLSITVEPSGVYDTVNFGDAIPHTVFGAVFQDDDGDGQLHFTEVGITDVTVDLYDDVDGDGQLSGGDSLRASTVTDFDGNYRFLSQLPGQVLLVVNTPPGYLSGTPTVVALSLFSGASGGLEFNFAVLPAAEIGGVVWDDANGDEEIDTGEVGLQSVFITLYDDADGDGLINAGEPARMAVSTDADGQFTFGDLYPGAYIVDIDDLSLPIAYLSSTGNDPLTLSLAAGETAEISFGYYRPLQTKTGGVGFWKREYRQLGKPVYSQAELDGFTMWANAWSRVFPEVDALDVSLLRNGHKTARQRAMQQLTALWSNIVSGRLTADASVDLGTVSDAVTVLQAALEADTIVADPLANDVDLDRARKIADMLNHGQ